MLRCGKGQVTCPAVLGREEGSSSGRVVREGPLAEMAFPLKLDKGKQLCRECRPDRVQRESAVAPGGGG